MKIFASGGTVGGGRGICGADERDEVAPLHWLTPAGVSPTA
jgi:hypothetical protein